jgi:hypothetical protein
MIVHEDYLFVNSDRCLGIQAATHGEDKVMRRWSQSICVSIAGEDCFENLLRREFQAQVVQHLILQVERQHSANT